MNDMYKLYVSINGSDNNDGSESSPFATPNKAICKVREIIANGLDAPVTVYFHAGDYKFTGATLSEEDSGTEEYPIKYTAYGDGEVIFNSGVTLEPSGFTKISDEIKERLQGDAKEKVLVYDLKTKGLTIEDISRLHSVGVSHMDDCYDDNTRGNNCELFWNNKRLTLARYPNKGFVKIVDVVDKGDITNDTRVEIRNPKGATIKIEEEVAERARNWKDLNDVRAFGYFYWDWADGSAPIKSIDCDKCELTFAQAISRGVAKNMYFNFYNVLDELDIPGEYYIDRENLLLYVYPPEDVNSSDIMISISNEVMLTIKKAEHITIEGITFKGTRNNCMNINSNNITIKNCTITDIYGWAIYCGGNNIKVYGCDISHTGRGGISLTGGDRKTFKSSGNVAENNYVHDWAEVFQTYASGIEVGGCGNVIRHNELCNTPHMAIYYSGNDEIIEYNYIHDVVLQSHDAGAVYGGRDWTAYGCEIRYNIIENAGNDEYHPNSIYWDDCHSGQKAYGNIIISPNAKGFLIGGGKDNVVENNVILGGECSILYDERGIAGVRDPESWYAGARKGGNNWPFLYGSPYKTEIWAKRFPDLARVHDDFDKIDDPDFAPNPSRAIIRNNVVSQKEDWGFFIGETVQKLGTIENNIKLTDASECWADASKYEIKPEILEKLPELKNIPIDKIGRYKD